MKKLTVLVLGLCFLTSCESTDTGKEIDYHYYQHFKMINNSGVQVAVVAGSEDFPDSSEDFPDSLVLLNRGTYEWKMGSRELVWPLDGYYAPKVYFDEDILVVHRYYDNSNRNPGSGNNYDFVKIDEFNNNYTFTFTPEDYQAALKQQ